MSYSISHTHTPIPIHSPSAPELRIHDLDGSRGNLKFLLRDMDDYEVMVLVEDDFVAIHLVRDDNEIFSYVGDRESVVTSGLGRG